MKRSLRATDAALERGRAAKRWIDRAETEGMEKVAPEVPPDDMAAVMEKMFSSTWGGLTGKQMGDLLRLMISWAKQDKDGALAWARNLEVSQQREIALTGIAAGVGKTDPMAGFEIYSETGTVTTAAAGRALEAMMEEVYRLAAAKGAEALVDIARRSPVNETRTIHGVRLEYPEGFDFATLMDGLAKISRSNMIFDKAIVPPDPMGQWVLRDPDAAFDYVASRIANGGQLRLDSMVYEMGEKSGSLEARRWIAGKLASVPSDQIPAFVRGAGVLNSPGIFRQYLQEMPAEAADEFRLQSVKLYPGYAMELLLDIPSVDDRVALVERLRGVKDADQILAQLKKWEVPQERIDQVGKTIRQQDP
ncbi:MAG: hypothetical protein EOP88_24800 [Verrucomicrobiaceae bacterium]|nr:MAG: hypothetical protein EOP88_24800 [Verrucomicrobiaceae bacterium]